MGPFCENRRAFMVALSIDARGRKFVPWVYISPLARRVLRSAIQPGFGVPSRALPTSPSVRSRLATMNITHAQDVQRSLVWSGAAVSLLSF